MSTRLDLKTAPDLIIPVSPTPSLTQGDSSIDEKPMEDVQEDDSLDDAESELSSEESVDGPPIPQPAYFYPHEYAQDIPPKLDSIWLTPEEDPMAARGIPVFQPTCEEFQDFEAYMESVAPWGHRSGIVKVIPPAEWTHNLPSIPNSTIANLRIKNPIQQNMLGRSGMFRQSTIEKKKALTVKEWWEKCRSAPFHYPGPKDAELRKRGNPVVTTGRANKRRKGEDTVTESAVDASVASLVENQSEASLTPAPQSERAASSTSMPEVDPWYDTFDPHSDWLPKETSQEDYTEDGCRALERKFWRELGLGEACWYGADMKGSLFTDLTTSWNVAHLPNLLNRLNLKRKLPGVNTPYLYWGMWAAAFAWHVEDMDLYSINYIHFGAPKFWYAIPQKKAEAFERHMAGYFPSDARKCDQFLRHKSFAVSPYNLGGQGSRPNIMVQKQGEFVITFPKGYHAGFNMGFNCAESINFALDDWIEMGRRAKVCRCESENVHIDVDAVLEESALREAAAQAREERRMKAESRKMDSATKTRRPRSSKVQGPDGEKKIRTKSLPEFKLPPKPTKPVFPCVLCPDPSISQLMAVHRKEDATEPEVSENADQMISELPLVKSGTKDRKKKPEYAHLVCVRSTPELWIADVWDASREQSARRVMGIEDIGRERWNLKCASCADDPLKQKHGSKIQCTKGKCVKAYHVTCALADPMVEFKEMEVDEWVTVPTSSMTTSAPNESSAIESDVVNTIQGDKLLDPSAPPLISATSPLEEKTTQGQRFERVTVVHAHCLCPHHNPAVAEQRKKDSRQSIIYSLQSLPYAFPVSLRLTTGIWGSFLLSFNSDDETVLVTNDKGVPFTVKWGQISFIPPVKAATDGTKRVVDTAPSRTVPQGLIHNKLQPGASVALTPQMIAMLSGNPLLRASLREIGLA